MAVESLSHIRPVELSSLLSGVFSFCRERILLLAKEERLFVLFLLFESSQTEALTEVASKRHTSAFHQLVETCAFVRTRFRSIEPVRRSDATMRASGHHVRPGAQANGRQDDGRQKQLDERPRQVTRRTPHRQHLEKQNGHTSSAALGVTRVPQQGHQVFYRTVEK